MKRALRHVLSLLLFAAAPAFALNAGLGEPPPTVDRNTPNEAVHGFLNAAHAGKYDLAAHYLWLDFLPRQSQAVEGPRLARRFKFVLDRQVWIDFTEISKEPTGDPSNPKWDQIGAIHLGNTNQPIRLTRVETGDGTYVWVFSPETVKSIDRLYDVYGPPLGDRIPDILFRHSFLQLEPWQWIGLLVLLGVATLVAVLGERLLLAIGTRVATITVFSWEKRLVEVGRGPLRVPIWVGVVAAGMRLLLLPPAVDDVFDHACYTALIVSLSWMLLRALGQVETSIQTSVTTATRLAADQGRFEGMRTQLSVMRRIAAMVVYVLSAALLLMQFEVVRHVGVSLLASAGLAGLVLGLAAQKSISTLLAGLQLTITRPISLGDAVVVEGESGTVEEITLTYVIIKLWDQRRMVIPMTWFLEKPFQNWSKGANEMMASATLLVCREADTEAFREELRRALEEEGRPLWDGRIPNLSVSEGPGKTLILRAVAGAAQRESTSPLRRLLQARLDALLQAHPEWFPPSSVARRPPPADRGPSPVPPPSH